MEPFYYLLKPQSKNSELQAKQDIIVMQKDGDNLSMTLGGRQQD